ncbi:MAG: GNAT family N-acetyltransferase [bacterium]
MYFDIIDQESTGLYRTFVDEHSLSTIFHTLDWHSVLRQSFKIEPRYYFLKGDTGEIKGVLPLFKVKKLNLKNYLVSLPFSNYGGYLISENVKEQDMQEKLQTLNYPVELKLFNLEKNSNTSPTVTFLIDLKQGISNFWNEQKSKTRQNIRKAEKRGFIFLTEGNYLKEFLLTYAENMKRMGTPQYPESFFKNMYSIIGDNCQTWAIKHKGSIIGVSIMLFYKKTAYNYLTMTKPEFTKSKPNDYLIWKTIEKSAELGYTTYDFGRSTKNTGAYNYKLKWKAKPVDLEYKILYQNKTVSTKVPQPGILSKIWSKLPLSVTRALGPIIRKYVP